MNTPLYFTDGKLLAESGNIKVYDFNGVLYLEQGPGHSLWADSAEIKELAEQLDDRPKGDCLEIGLGLGVASRFILSKPDVESLTTIEINQHVIEVYKKLNPIVDEKHHVIWETGLNYLYKTKRTFDFIFLDFYDCIDEETLPQIRDQVDLAKDILRSGGEIMGWFDPYTPDEFVDEFFEIFGEVLF